MTLGLDFIALGPKLTELLSKGVQFYMAAPSGSTDATVDAVAVFIERCSMGWNPKIQGQTFLDDPATRRAGARFLAGIAVKVAATPTLAKKVK